MDEGNRWIMWGMFFLLVGLAFFVPLVDNDFGWHYVCGQRILSGSRWCLENDLTYLLPEYRWAYTAFVYDALIAFVYDRGGFLLLSVLGSVVVVALTWLGVKRLKGPDWWRMVCVGLVLYLCWFGLLGSGLKSQWLSLLGLVWLLGELLREKPRWGWVILLSWLWANSHSGFWLAPVVVGMYWVGELFLLCSTSEQSRPESKTDSDEKHCLWVPYSKKDCPSVDPMVNGPDPLVSSGSPFKDRPFQARMTGRVSFLLFGVVGVTFLNPFGWQVYEELWKHFKMPLSALIAEWTAPIGWQLWSVLGLGVLGFVWLVVRKKNLSKFWFRLLVLVGLFLLALMAKRNLALFYFGWLMVVFGEPFLTRYTSEQSRSESRTDFDEKHLSMFKDRPFWSQNDGVGSWIMVMGLLPLLLIWFGLRVPKVVRMDSNWNGWSI